MIKKALTALLAAICTGIVLWCALVPTGLFSRDEAQRIRLQPVQAVSQAPESDTQGRLNVNTASMEELVALPGIGQVTATAIVEARVVSPFYFLEDLKTVPGIGDSKLDTIRPLICLSD